MLDQIVKQIVSKTNHLITEQRVLQEGEYLHNKSIEDLIYCQVNNLNEEANQLPIDFNHLYQNLLHAPNHEALEEAVQAIQVQVELLESILFPLKQEEIEVFLAFQLILAAEKQEESLDSLVYFNNKYNT